MIFPLLKVKIKFTLKINYLYNYKYLERCTYFLDIIDVLIVCF